jgi:SAM-dependent methyltransferase
VSTCSEKQAIADRVALELKNIHPRPPALRLFDAGVGDGTVLARVMRAMHARFPTMPFYIVGKEVSMEDVRLVLEKMPDRFHEHPATVLVMTNMLYAEAPWLRPRSPAAAAALVWKDVALTGNSSHEFEEQIAGLNPFLAENWKASVSPTSGNPVYERPVVLVLYRNDHRFLLDPIIPHPGRAEANFDLVIASQPYRARASTEFKAKRVIAPLARALRPGGRLLAIHSCGNDPGMEVIQTVWPGDNPFVTDRHSILRAVKHELGTAGRDLEAQFAHRRQHVPLQRDHHRFGEEMAGEPPAEMALVGLHLAQDETRLLGPAIAFDAAFDQRDLDGEAVEARPDVLDAHGAPLWPVWDGPSYQRCRLCLRSACGRGAAAGHRLGRVRAHPIWVCVA